MDEMLYNCLSNYYNVLEKTGYVSYPTMQKLLLVCFYRDFTYQDYRGILSKDDYHTIELALNCLWGSTCLIPYPDYLKMGKLHLGDTTELSQRIKTLEDTDVLKSFDEVIPDDSDIIITEDSEE